MEKKQPDSIDLSETTLKTKMVIPMLLFVITTVSFFLGFKYTMEAEARKFAFDVQINYNTIKSVVSAQDVQIKLSQKSTSDFIEEFKEQKQKVYALQIELIELKAKR